MPSFSRLLVLMAMTTCLSQNLSASECVALLHGLARTDQSMNGVASSLADEGYSVANVGYPSRDHPIQTLSRLAVEQALAQCPPDPQAIHFVTHSLGGILLRHYLAQHEIEKLGRVVMLAPPNQGSEVVDRLRRVPGYKLINGPAGLQLGTDAESVPSKLGPAEFEVGVIAGTKSVNLILSLMIPGTDDGKVSVERARLEGMADFVLVPHSHPFIMNGKDTRAHILSFLKHGRFEQPTEPQRKLP